MKPRRRAALIVPSLLIACAGCMGTESSGPAPEKKVESPPTIASPDAPEPPIVPSPVPAMPTSTKGDPEPKGEAKPETPK